MFNQLYVELKADMASAALEGLPAKAELRDQFFYIWSNWMRWAVSNPEKRRALAQLGVSDEITPATRAAGHKTMTKIAELMQRCRSNGPMRDAPMGFVSAIMSSLAEATMDYMVRNSGPGPTRKSSLQGRVRCSLAGNLLTLFSRIMTD